MPTVFFSYSHADETLRNELEKQLSMLKRQGIIETWHDRRIGAGQDIDLAIDARINNDDIILLLVSPDFLASKYCYDVEMSQALERHERGEAIVIPVILRPCDWHSAPFGKLNATPADGKPITKWTNLDEALLEVVKAVREAAARPARKTAKVAPIFQVDGSIADAKVQHTIEPRSSNLRISKSFTQRERDRFKIETFEYMARFFENSLNELNKRNPGIEVGFRRVDANRFFSSVYQHGMVKARCTIFLGEGGTGSGICFVNGETTNSNTINESLRVEADDQTLFLQGTGLAFRARGDEQRLSQEGAAELYWGLLIDTLQR